MNELLEIKQAETSTFSIGQEYYVDGAASLQNLAYEPMQYNIFMKNETTKFLPLEDRANDTRKLFVMKMCHGENCSSIMFDKRGLNEMSLFSPVTRSGTRIDFQPPTAGLAPTWIDNFNEAWTANSIEIGLRAITDKIKKFALLKPGWDSYGAKPVQWNTILQAIIFFSKVLASLNRKGIKSMPLPFIAPLINGGIQFEWRTCYKELIIALPPDKNSKIEFLKVKQTIDEEKEENGETASVNDVIEIVTEWLFN